ncbi:hypothetical protein K0M31_019547, partial [Melipona bicolor]
DFERRLLPRALRSTKSQVASRETRCPEGVRQTLEIKSAAPGEVLWVKSIKPSGWWPGYDGTE